ncbi:S8 family serine peptidase [Mycoplasmopsis agassizii]|uniref:S8 family serine peptidase n=1 Tax=Mycoplasmopsis agassizii TaxID=33922 RepID=UPI003529093F
MKKYKRNLWSLLGLSTASLAAVGALVSVSYSSNSQQQNVVEDLKTQKEDTSLSKDKKTLRRKYVEELLKSDSIKDIVSQTSFNYKKPEFIKTLSSRESFQKVLNQGANRVDIVFKAGTDKTKLNTYLEQMYAILGNDFETLYGKYTLTFSIAYKDLNDFKKLVLKISEFDFYFNDLLQVNVHETGRSTEEFNTALRKISLEESDLRHRERFYVPKTFWDDYNSATKKRYGLIGLDYQTLNQERMQAYNNINYGKAEMKVGIIEAVPRNPDSSSYVDKNSSAFIESSKIITRGTSNLPFKEYSHPNMVADVIMGRQGINPNIMLFSDVTSRWNGWLNSTLNWFLYRGVYMVNNSWGAEMGTNEEYNSDSEWLDNFLNENEDFIFIISAGNSYIERITEGKKSYTTSAYKYLDYYTLSHNAIVVGALESTQYISPYLDSNGGTEVSKDQSYVTTSVPDSFSPTGLDLQGRYLLRGTSFAAPTITGIASLLKTNYPEIFKQGSDYMILKSALISGSRQNWYNTLFLDITGKGFFMKYTFEFKLSCVKKYLKGEQIKVPKNTKENHLIVCFTFE